MSSTRLRTPCSRIRSSPGETCSCSFFAFGFLPTALAGIAASTMPAPADAIPISTSRRFRFSMLCLLTPRTARRTVPRPRPWRLRAPSGSHGTGADVMKRIAAPMVGGVVTSALLELAVYPALGKALARSRIDTPHRFERAAGPEQRYIGGEGDDRAGQEKDAERSHAEGSTHERCRCRSHADDDGGDDRDRATCASCSIPFSCSLSFSPPLFSAVRRPLTRARCARRSSQPGD